MEMEKEFLSFLFFTRSNHYELACGFDLALLENEMCGTNLPWLNGGPELGCKLQKQQHKQVLVKLVSKWFWKRVAKT